GRGPAARRRAQADGRGRVGLRTTVLIALLVAGPLIGLPLSFITSPGAIDQFSGFLPEAVAATFWILIGVGGGTLVLGTSLAALVSFFEFPGRRWIEWALVLPLAMPSYVFTLFALGLKVPGIRSTGGAVLVFTLVLYPYVYLLARSAFLSQSRTLIEAARGLGMSRARAILRVGIPLARPAILGGVLLALMEALADFGTVNLLGVQTFTNAIYRVWFEAFDRDAAMQLATLLVSVTLTLLALERLARGRARHAQLAARGDLVPPVRLRGVAAIAAAVVPLALVALVVGAPLVQLAVWSVHSIRDGLLPIQFGASVRNSLLLSGMSAVLVPITALLLAYGARSSRSRVAATAARTATIGYGLPGSVVAVAVIVPLGWLDRRLDGAFGTGLLLTGTVIGLFYAYLVRFLALAWGAVESSLIRIPRQLDDAARGLGSDRLDVLARVHVPLLRSGLVTAALLIFVEVMKELPATLLLRPLGGDTMAIAVWQATTESLFRTAALPALMIVLVGLLPVALMVRFSGRAGAGEVEASPAAAAWVEEPQARVAA